MNIIGIGKAGCAIAEMFKQHEQYNVFQIDAECKYDNSISLGKKSSVEMYDSEPVKIEIENDEDVSLFVCGAGKVSGCTLRVLENFKKRNITLYYIFPKTDLLDNKGKLRNRAHYGILQQYARSGLFKKMFVFHNENIKDIVGKTSVLNYYRKINEMIVNSIHMLNFFNNSESIFDVFQSDLNTCRIATIASIDIDTEEEKEFFSLKNVNQIKYFFGVNRLTIEEDEELMTKIESLATSKSDENCITSYGIFETTYDYNFCLAIKSTAEIQTLEN